ncbi:MAG TPA: hypothetical protein VHD57_02240 [Vicinamibacterales bacterium]|jgi:hypothetical protein|nr:hypothetical protein [Vicinamibacterales bacterium]
MARPAKTAAGQTPRETDGVHLVAIPRLWLTALVVLFVAPWVVVAMFYRGGRPQADAVSARSVPAAAAHAADAAGNVGPWGRLEVTPITISPPAEYIPRTWGPVAAPEWHFPGMTADAVAGFLASAGVSPDDIQRLRATARPEPLNRGVVVRPDERWLIGMPPDVRARIYLKLGRSPLNFEQITAYRYFGATSEAWLGSVPIEPATRRLVDPLIYRIGDFEYFADVDRIRSQIDDPEELQRLVKGLLRVATVVVDLHVDNPSDVKAITDYWGLGGHQTDIRPLLESIAGTGHAIDVSHLLPIFVRQHLYRYPKLGVEDLEKPVLANCFWTALNFFNDVPDDKYLNVNVAVETLKRDYYVVNDDYQLGDIVAFSDGGGNLFHVAVYIADGLVFGKNGLSPLAPWTILPLDQIKGHYIEEADGWQVTYHRRKGL